MERPADKQPHGPHPYPCACYPYPIPVPRHRSGGKTNLASCALAVAFLLILVSAAGATCFFLFRPHEPEIHVSAVQLPGFAARNGSVSFTFAQYAAVRNPNRAVFSHYDSSIRLMYGGEQVGFMYIPAGEIAGGRTQYMEASFSVSSFPVAASPAVAVGTERMEVEVETRMKLKGRVRVLRFVGHHVEATAGCRVGVSAGDGAVLGLRC